MQLSSKKANAQTTTITFNGGLNLSEPATNIQDNELQECLNMYYANQQSFLTTRMGIKKIDVPALNDGIDKLYEYIKSESEIFLTAVSSGSLYYLSSSMSGSNITLFWEKITDLANPTIIPGLTTYQHYLVIADRGLNLRYWDGTTTTTLTGSPTYPTIVEELGGRLICNSDGSGEEDRIYGTAPYNIDEWNSNNGAFNVPAGYQDGKHITGIGVLASDIIVFKEGKLTYRINCSGTSSSWSTSRLFQTNSCSNQNAIEPIGNDILFGTSSGINSVQTVKEYGDIQVNQFSYKINSILNGKGVREITYSTLYGAAFCLIDGTDTILMYHPHNNAFTTFDFGIRLTSIIEGRDYTWAADNNGNLYKLTNIDKDELTIGTLTDIHSRIVTKTYTFPDAVLLSKCRIYFEQIDYTKGYLSILDKSGESETILYDWEPNFAGYLYDANYYLYDADNIYIYGDPLSYFDSLSEYEDYAFSFVFDCSLGRVKIKSLTVTLTATST